MELINTKNNNKKEEINTDKLDDYLSLQLEHQEETVKFYKKYGMYIWAFTLDSQGRGGGFYNLPENQEERTLFVCNMKEKIEHLTNGAFILAINPDYKNKYGK